MRINRLLRSSEPDGDNATVMRIDTDAGVIDCRYHAAQGDAGIVWVFGAGGGLGGPAGGLYTRLANQFAPEGIASLRVDYRRPGRLTDCVLDVMAAAHVLAEEEKTRLILVGHSFGGAVVIAAGVKLAAVIGVAALSPQTAGAQDVRHLSPKRLLLMHGTRDEVLPHSCSETIYSMARQPKQIEMYDCRHGLDECREEIDRDLSAWIRAVVTRHREQRVTAYQGTHPQVGDSCDELSGPDDRQPGHGHR